jgi:tetratricopeptide (TPR) repeat protein
MMHWPTPKPAETVDRTDVPFGFDGLLGGIYLLIGRPERSIEWYDPHLESDRDPLAAIRANRILALVLAGSIDEATVEAAGVVDAAAATGNPYALSYALMAYGFASRGPDPDGALNAMRRGLVIAHDSGIRSTESYLALNIGLLEGRQGDTIAALEHLTVAIRIYHDSGSTTSVRSPLMVLAEIFDRLGRHVSAATIAGFAVSPLTPLALPQNATAVTHLRDVLGDQTYESLAHQGETMTTTEIATYAYDQIEQTRTELNAVPK